MSTSYWADGWRRIGQGLRRRPMRVALGLAAACVAITLALFCALIAWSWPVVQAPAAPVLHSVAYAQFGASDRELQEAQRVLEGAPSVQSLRFLDRDQALRWMKERYRAAGAGDALAEINGNPLPDAWMADFAPGVSADLAAAEIERWRQSGRFDRFTADLDGYRLQLAAWPVRHQALRAIPGLVALVLASLLLWASASFCREAPEQIRAWRLLGASTRYQTRAARWGGGLIMIAGALAALVVVGATGRAVVAWLAPAVASSFGASLQAPPWPGQDGGPDLATTWLILLASAAVSGILGALLGELRARWLLGRVTGP